jgi:hypothetical protein
LAEVKTYEEWLEAVGEDGSMLVEVPEDMKTEEMCLTAVMSMQYDDPWKTLESVPKELLTYDLCYVAVERYAIAIEVVPEELITEDMCIVAVRQGKDDTGEYLSSVPEKFWTKAVVLEALKNSHIGRGFDFPEIPEEFWKDPEIFKIASKHIDFDNVPESAWEDMSFCRMAIETRGYFLDYVPEKNRTLEICLAALKRSPEDAGQIFESIPETMLEEVKKMTGLE